MQTLRCPLCAEAFQVRDVQECEAHISQCKAFRAEFGPGAPRSGLVADFQTACAPSASSPSALDERAVLRETCECLAAALLPLIPYTTASCDGRSVEESIDLIVALVNTLITAPIDPGADDEFGMEELITITLGPYLSPLDVARADLVRATLARSLEVVANFTEPADGQSMTAALQDALTRGMAEFRYCDGCGKSDCRLLACSRCKCVRYCGSSCQRKCWLAHKPHCVVRTAAEISMSMSKGHGHGPTDIV